MTITTLGLRDRTQPPVTPPRPRDTRSAPLKLNFFQQAMLLWERVHPYCAAHAVRLSGKLDADALREAITWACLDAGIGALDIDQRSQTYAYGPPGEIPLDVHPPATDADAVLTRIINDQMNTRFPEHPHHPIRWTAFDDAATDSHYLVLVYHHVASDAIGIEALIATVVKRYVGLPISASNRRLNAIDAATGEWLGARLGPLRFARGWIRMACIHRDLLRVYRVPDDSSLDDRTGLVIRSLDDELVPRLSETCRRIGVGMNDAFLAAMGCGVAENLPQLSGKFWRRRLGLATVASARKSMPSTKDEFFGVCLADLVAIVDRPEKGVRHVAEYVARQTRRLKGDWDAASASSAVRVFVIRRCWPLLHIRNQRSSYRRSFPLSAGVSTVFVDVARFGEAARFITRYVRAAPTGPAVPMVLAPTAWGDRLDIGLVHRIANLQPDKANALMNSVVARLTELSHARA